LLALWPESVLDKRRGLGGGKTYNLMIHHYQSHHQISVSSSKSFFLAIITLAQNVQSFTAKNDKTKHIKYLSPTGHYSKNFCQEAI